MIEGISEPQFDTWGMGLTHMAVRAANTKPCVRCEGTGFVGHPLLPLQCPVCEATGSITKL